MKNSPELTPDHIREIRKGLGLTQEDASRLLGCGPRVFSKYESGNLKPCAAVVNLLRVLDEIPGATRILRGEEVHLAASTMPAPFEVNADNIASLKPSSFSDLLRRLLHAEAQQHGIPEVGIHVASTLNAPDGGEDGRISWRGEPNHTRFLPFRLCQFQLKTSNIRPARAGKEVVTNGGEVKPMVRSVLEQGGHYIMLCAHPYNRQQIEERQRKICSALMEAGLQDPGDQIRIMEASQIAVWVNAHPPVALWVREKKGLGTPGGFVTWEFWKGRSEHSVPWVNDPRLTDLCCKLRERVTKPRSVLRVVGLSGIGKSRLCLEALKRIDDHQIAGRSLRDFVIYVVQSEEDMQAAHLVVRELAATGGRAIVVVDDCDFRQHDNLTRLVARQESRLSLLTIDNEIPSQIDANNTIKLEEAPEIVIETIVDQVARHMQGLDRQRLVRLSEGFPEIAIRIARESKTRRHLTYSTNDELINEFVCGRRPEDKGLLLQSAQRIAVFGPVRIESTAEADLGTVQTYGAEYSTGGDLARIAGIGRQMTREDLYAGIQVLTQRGVCKRSGGLGTIQPRPIAVALAKRQWIEWDKKKWDQVLSGGIGSYLSVSAAQRLAQLNFSDIANNVAEHVCRKDGSFDQGDGIVAQGRAKVLSALAEIAPDAVAQHIDRSLNRLVHLHNLTLDVRSSLVRALSTIAFRSRTFMIGARLLLRLAVAESKLWRAGASRQFVKLFSPILGGTEADGE